MKDLPLDPKAVDLVLAGIIRELTGGMCVPGRVCGPLNGGYCDCFASRDLFAMERTLAANILRDGVAQFSRLTRREVTARGDPPPLFS